MTKGDGIKKKFLNNLVVSEKHFTFADDKLIINIKSITMDELDNIQDHIYVIRSYRVMFDFDLAKLYEVKTSALNQAVKRNPKRFEGEEFMFQLSDVEWENFTKSDKNTSQSELGSPEISAVNNLRSQIVISRFHDNWGGNRRPPYAFTEIGVAMLSGVLKSKVAICDLEQTTPHRLYSAKR